MYVIGYAELTTTAINIAQPHARDARGAHRPRRSSTSRSSGASPRDPRRSRRGSRCRRSDRCPTGPGRSPLHPRGGASRDAPRVRDRGRRERGDRHRPRDAPDDRVPAVRRVIRCYIEVFRGLPILVTVFIVYFGLPSVSPTLEFGPLTATAIALILWGSAQVAEATRGAVQSIPHEQHEAAAALGFGWVGRHALGDPPAGVPAAPAAVRQPARQHHPELDARRGDRRDRAAQARSPRWSV